MRPLKQLHDRHVLPFSKLGRPVRIALNFDVDPGGSAGRAYGPRAPPAGLLAAARYSGPVTLGLRSASLHTLRIQIMTRYTGSASAEPLSACTLQGSQASQ